MAGQFVAAAPVASKQADDKLPLRVKHQHRGIGAFMFQQGGQRPHSYASCTNKGVGSKAWIGLGQQRANTVKGRGLGGAKAGRGKELNAGNVGGVVLLCLPQRLAGQTPRAGGKAGCQTLRQWQGRARMALRRLGGAS